MSFAIVIFPRFYGHTTKRVISNPEVTNENRGKIEHPIHFFVLSWITLMRNNKSLISIFLFRMLVI